MDIELTSCKKYLAQIAFENCISKSFTIPITKGNACSGLRADILIYKQVIGGEREKRI